MVHDIAIVGMGCRFPGAPDVAAFWQVIQRGEPQIGQVPRERWWDENHFAPGDFRALDRVYTDRGAYLDEIDQFSPLHYAIPPRRAEVMDPQHRLLLDAARAALQDAGLEQRHFDRGRTGVFIGASGSEYAAIMTSSVRVRQALDGAYGRPSVDDGAIRAAMLETVEAVPAPRAYSMPGVLVNMAATTVSQAFGLSGPSFTMDAACSSSLVALNEAVMHLRTGSCSVALVGGVYLNLIPDMMVGFCRVGALSFSGHCRPFDERADGFVFGEGVGAVVLRPLEDALTAGDRIYAVIRGTACNNDGTAEGSMTPKTSGQLVTMRQACADADMDPLSVGYIEAHGTATTVGDRAEAAAMVALRDAPGAAQATCYVSSVKSLIGHSLSSAGVAGLIKAALCVYHGVIPPQPDVRPHPGYKLEAAGLRMASEPVDWAAFAPARRRAGVSSFGFGGTNVHVLLEQAPTAETAPVADRPDLFVFSSGSPELLERHLGDILAEVDRHPDLPLSSLAHTLATRRLLTARVAIVAGSRDELRRRILAARGALSEAVRTDGLIADGVYVRAESVRPSKRKVAFLLPDQSSRQPDLPADLIDRFPQVRLPAADAHGSAWTGLLDALAVRADVVPGHGAAECPTEAPPGVAEPDLAPADAQSGHPATQVGFMTALDACDEAGARVYVQVAGDSSLLSSARAAVADRPGDRWFVALTGDGPDDARTFLAGIGQLAVLGVPVELPALFIDGQAHRILDLPISPLATQRYWGIDSDSAVSAPERPLELSPRTAQAGPMAVLVPTAQGTASSRMDQLVALFREQAAVLGAVAVAGSAVLRTAPPPEPARHTGNGDGIVRRDVL